MDTFANLPAPMKWFLGVTGLGTLFAAGWFGSRGGWQLLLIFAVLLLVLLLIIVGGYLLWNRWQRKKQSDRLGGDLQQGAAATPRGMSATDLAKLDNLRRKFQEGVEAFRSRGKDLYTLPWYVIIGEPGSGKTEAVRHCNVGFPPGMHEGENDVGYMGAGGTLNMNWWFTNYAVLLDTAGRLVFEEVKPGETSEWKEFLKLLKKNRPHCPINGLLLVIPSDSLIKDTADQIAAKAGKIAQQLDVIQRVLDFRFPVYVVITKSDKINGFREFFENVSDPQLQHQMLGWSNPDTLDSPFRPEMVDKHLTQVTERLRRRRLGLMRDPVPESAQRRIDEVDSLFALPNSLLLLGPRMRKYLETIFMPGEWSSKPLFLRGIYFTSSMREGAALDQELAEAIGVPAEDLPEGKQWERDRAYFLKDLFLEKVFREKGLVTRATNTGALLRRRQMVIYASTFVALAVFVTIAWLGMRAVRASVGDRSAYWAEAATQNRWADKNWRPSIVSAEAEADGSHSPATDRYLFVQKEKMSIGEIHQKLRELAEVDLKGRWTSPGMASRYNQNSKQAQRVVFDAGVLQPLADAARQRMLSLNPEVQVTNQPEALVALIRLEAGIRARAKGGDVPLDARAATSFLGPLLRFATGTDASPDSNIVSVMLWTYSTNKAGLNKWPPAWLSSTAANKDGEPVNPVLMAGLDYFIRRATNTVQVMAADWNGVSALVAALTDYEKAEKTLSSAVAEGSGRVSSQLFQSLLTAKEKVDAQLKLCSKSEVFAGGLSLTNAFANFTNNVTRYAAGAFVQVETENDNALKADPTFKVFQDIRVRLKGEQNKITGTLTSIITPELLAKLLHLDECFLAQAAGRPLYQLRGDLYASAKELASDLFSGGTRAELLEKFQRWDSARQKLSESVADYKGCLQVEVGKVAAFYRDQAAKSQAQNFLVAYQRAADRDLGAGLGFPVLRDPSARMLTGDELDGAQKLLAQIADELGLIAGRKLEETKSWRDFTARTLDLARVVKIIKGSDEKPNFCAISLCKRDDDQHSEEDQWRNGLRYIRLDAQGADLVGSNNAKEESLGTVQLRGPLALQLLKQSNTDVYKAVPSPKWTAWGPLYLIAQQGGKPQADGSWLVSLPTNDPTYKGSLRLALKFDQPLPDLDHWPKN